MRYHFAPTGLARIRYQETKQKASTGKDVEKQELLHVAAEPVKLVHPYRNGVAVSQKVKQDYRMIQQFHCHVYTPKNWKWGLQ